MLGKPNDHLLLAGVSTSQRSVQYYLGWFTRCYALGETGWAVSRTPDGRAIMHQDAFFWRALEVVAHTMNLRIMEERERLSRGSH